MNTPRRQSVSRDAAYVYSAYVLRYLSMLVLVPYYGRVLGPDAYGTVLAAMSLMQLVWMVINWGFSPTGTRDMAGSATDVMRSSIFARQISARLVLLPVSAAIGIAGTMLSPMLRAHPGFGAIATALGVLNGSNVGWLFQGLRRFRLSLVFEAMVYPINVVLVLLLVRHPTDGLYALLALLSSTVLATTSAYATAIRMVRPASLSLKAGWLEIQSAASLFVQSVNSMLLSSGSTYLLSVLSTASQVGYFGAVERLVTFGLAFLQPAAAVMLPTITHRAKHDPVGLQRLIQKAVVLEVLYGICACAGGVLLAPWIVQLAFGPNFAPSVTIMRTMLLVLPFATLTHALGVYVLLPQNRERLLVSAYVAGSVISLSLAAVLSRMYGGQAVAWARVTGEFTTCALVVLLFVRFPEVRAFLWPARSRG